MSYLKPDRSIPAVVTEDERLSLAASLEKKDPLPVNDDDSTHEGLEFPSKEELATLRRVSDTIPWTAYSAFRSRSLAFHTPIPTVCSDRCRRVG